MSYPKLLEQVIDQLSKLPGVGKRSAERMAFWLLNNSAEDSLALADSITHLKQRLQFCSICNHLTETDLCTICQDPRREEHILCVVENPKDLIAIEKTGSFKGRYHVLLGAIAPAEGRGPEELKINLLVNKVKSQGITEVVIATDPDTEGEMTAIHIVNELKPLGIKVSRIGLGIPMGSSVEFADLSTLTMSLNARREL